MNPVKIHVQISEQQNNNIKELIKQNRYKSINEAVRAAVDLLPHIAPSNTPTQTDKKIPFDVTHIKECIQKGETGSYEDDDKIIMGGLIYSGLIDFAGMLTLEELCFYYCMSPSRYRQLKRIHADKWSAEREDLLRWECNDPAVTSPEDWKIDHPNSDYNKYFNPELFQANAIKWEKQKEEWAKKRKQSDKKYSPDDE